MRSRLRVQIAGLTTLTLSRSVGAGRRPGESGAVLLLESRQASRRLVPSLRVVHLRHSPPPMPSASQATAASGAAYSD